MDEPLAQAAREYHRCPNARERSPSPPTKQLTNQRDLSLAYSPGRCSPCLDIKERSR